ncbi:uncharacterized protein LOC142573868 [Dermacentor variabilis]|uniref:uncharacterized protein LOC142573868 n=1 Tax=Dermacentor variabilis TaxID=34621 RepID=UPI003F5B965C
MANKPATVNPGLQQPPPLDFDKTSEWPAWIDHFDDYRFATALNERSGEAQVRTLLYTMGRQAREVFATFELTDDEAKSYDVVKQRFNSHFVKERNIVYESACFHRRQQRPEESVDQFATALHVLADRCDFGDMKKTHPGQVCRRAPGHATIRGLADGSAAYIGYGAGQGSPQGNRASAAAEPSTGGCPHREPARTSGPRCHRGRRRPPETPAA